MEEIKAEESNESVKRDAQKLAKGERKRLKREEKQREKERVVKQRVRKQLIKRVVLLGLPVVLVVGVVWVMAASPERSDNNIVSRRGIHWHPSLAITINGESRDIPANIGLGGIHKDIHTHSVNDTLHVEMSRAVREDDVRVKKFFDIWGERFTSECILDVCNSDDGTVEMFVNGEKNSEFENYLMQEGDRIEIVYE